MSERRKLHSLTVVAPFYDEEAGLATFYRELAAQVEKLNLSCDFVFVDDGSEDRTLELLTGLAEQDPRITVLSLSRNFGHQAALTAGLDHAEGEAVVVMDSDLQHPPDVIPRLIEAYEQGAEIVSAVRANPKAAGFFKQLASRLYYRLLHLLGDTPVIPDAADFRLMSRSSVLALRGMRETHRYLRGMVPWLGFSHATVSYEQPKRYAGSPSYTLGKSLRLARHGLFSFSTAPLDLVTLLGLLLTALGAVYFCYILTIKFYGQAVSGWASVIVVILVLGGVQLISLGVLAQYVAMIFEQAKERPLYILKYKRPRRRARGPETESQ